MSQVSLLVALFFLLITQLRPVIRHLYLSVYASLWVQTGR